MGTVDRRFRPWVDGFCLEFGLGGRLGGDWPLVSVPGAPEKERGVSPTDAA